MAPSPATLLLVDGHAYAYRSFFAIRSLSSPAGAPTNAIFGFIKALDRMRTALKPSHIAVVWDGGLAAERVAALPGYKAQRPPMPPDLERQLDPIVDYLRAQGLASLCQDGVEADDWIGGLALQAAARDARVIVASSDKDFMQLVSDRIGLFNPNDKSEKIWGAEDVMQKTGVRPNQIVDWLSLIGDAVDNVPGVPGVGPKTATRLLGQFDTVERLFQRLGEVENERLRASLSDARTIVVRNQGLIRLKAESAGSFSLEDHRIQPADAGRLLVLFTEWGFKTMKRELEARAPAQATLF
jgi:DNA polymerase-1